MSPSTPVNVLFITSHNEEVTLKEPELSRLALLLDTNGIVVSSTSLPLDKEDLTPYQIVVLGNPLDSTFSKPEVSTLAAYVESGGGLLVLSGATIFGKGGDAARNTNLNAIMKPFALEFSDMAIRATLTRSNGEGKSPDDMITAIPSAKHPIVTGIRCVLFLGATSIMSGNKAQQILRASSYPGNPIVAVAQEVKNGRVVALGGTTPFFNDYIEIRDHSTFIIQTFRWLANIPTDQEIVLLSTPQLRDDVEPSSVTIEELRNQLDAIEEELHSLKKMIHSSLKEMEKIVQKIQQEKDQDEKD